MMNPDDVINEEAGDVPTEVKTEAKSFGHFVLSLEDGVLNDHLSRDLQKLSKSLQAHVANYGGKAKGKLSLSLEFSTDDSGIFEINADYKMTEPKIKRPRSILWADEDHNFTPQNPRQNELFGVRDVTRSQPRHQKQL